MDCANCSLGEVLIALVGVDHLEDMTAEKKYCIGAMLYPVLNLYANNDWSTFGDKSSIQKILLAKLDSIQNTFNEKYPKVMEQQKENTSNSTPDLEEGDPVLKSPIRIEDSSDEESVSNKTFDISETNKENQDSHEVNGPNLNETFTLSKKLSPPKISSVPISPLQGKNTFKPTRLFGRNADWEESNTETVESPVLKRLKENRRKRPIAFTGSPEHKADKKLKLDSSLELLKGSEDAADDQENTEPNSQAEFSSRPVTPNEGDVIHFTEMIGPTTDSQRSTNSTVESNKSKWTKCSKCKKRVQCGDLESHIEKNHPAFQNEPENSLEKIDDRVNEESPQSNNSEDSQSPPNKSVLDELSENLPQEPLSSSTASPSKVLLREDELVKYTRPFSIYIEPLPKETILRYTCISSKKKDPVKYQLNSKLKIDMVNGGFSPEKTRKKSRRRQ